MRSWTTVDQLPRGLQLQSVQLPSREVCARERKQA